MLQYLNLREFHNQEISRRSPLEIVTALEVTYLVEDKRSLIAIPLFSDLDQMLAGNLSYYAAGHSINRFTQLVLGKRRSVWYSNEDQLAINELLEAAGVKEIRDYLEKILCENAIAVWEERRTFPTLGFNWIRVQHFLQKLPADLQRPYLTFCMTAWDEIKLLESSPQMIKQNAPFPDDTENFRELCQAKLDGLGRLSQLEQERYHRNSLSTGLRQKCPYPHGDEEIEMYNRVANVLHPTIKMDWRKSLSGLIHVMDTLYNAGYMAIPVDDFIAKHITHNGKELTPKIVNARRRNMNSDEPHKASNEMKILATQLVEDLAAMDQSLDASESSTAS